MRLIDADELLTAFPVDDEPTLTKSCVRMTIQHMPTIEPERIKGRWIKISPAGIYECSVCGQNVMTNDIATYKFCHGCGADMREETDNGTD